MRAVSGRPGELIIRRLSMGQADDNLRTKRGRKMRDLPRCWRRDRNCQFGVQMVPLRPGVLRQLRFPPERDVLGGDLFRDFHSPKLHLLIGADLQEISKHEA